MPIVKRRQNPRNQKILKRRRMGQSWASIGKSFGISAARVRYIFEREESRMKRAQELAEAARLPQQPNAVQLPPRLRDLVAVICGKQDFTPDDVMEVDCTPALFFLRQPLNRRDWKDLSAWMAAGGFLLERPRREARSSS